MLEAVKSQGINLEAIPILIIDDECDFHSLNPLGRRGSNRSVGGRRPRGATSYTVQNESETLVSIAEEQVLDVEEIRVLNPTINNDIVSE